MGAGLMKVETEGWLCEKCGHENKLDKETTDRALRVAERALISVPIALTFGAMKAVAWLLLGVAALKFVGVI